MKDPHYRPDLAMVHHLGFSQHASACAPGILRLLQPILDRNGLVVELGCGSGALTTHLIAAGHRVVATDASPAMVDLAQRHAIGAEDVRVLALPDDAIPACDAIVSTGHVMSYLQDDAAIDRAIAAASAAVRPNGLIAFDICDLEWGRRRNDAPPHARIGDDWAIITRYEQPDERRFVRHLTAFLRSDDATWRRDDERHDNVLIDVSRLPRLMAQHGVDADVRDCFGDETLPEGLKVIVGFRPV